MSSVDLEPTPSRPPDGTGRPCVLIADDDPDILFLVRRLLEREGYEVVQAPGGDEALRLARERSLDLLILDVSMPGTDGHAVCRELQVDGADAPPVIFLTAHAHTSARVSGLDAGAVDYVTKPFQPDELRARVRAALRQKTVKDVLANEAATDALTGLLNRSQLESRIREMAALAGRHGRPFACLMIDLDRFKAINDTYGHSAGDAVLMEAARRFERQKRISDVLIRYGGEEFVALLPADEEGALALAERLRAVLAAAPVVFRPDGGQPIEISVRASVGIAHWRRDMDDPAQLVAAADAALYRAKALGRNRVEVAAAPEAA
jgi:diguanylate cyclase (GGDEF)-like protein